MTQDMLTTRNTLITIKGAPGGPEGKWGAVQAIQHEPFVYIMANGSKWAGEEEDGIDVLLTVLRTFPLDLERFDECVDPCAGVRNPEWTFDTDGVEKWIDGPRLYTCDGVVSFSGNFTHISHGFSIDTNDRETILALRAAIAENAKLPVLTGHGGIDGAYKAYCDRVKETV